MVLAVGIDPTVQQTIVVDTRLAPATLPASIPRARSFMETTIVEYNSVYDQFLDSVPPGMITFLYTGIYSAQSEKVSVDVVPDCPTNDCTFPRFESLAVCSSCEDYTQHLERSCFTLTSSKPKSAGKNVTQCTFSLPNGLRANHSDLTPGIDTLAVSAKSSWPEPGTILDWTSINASHSDVDGSITANASKCSLFWCVNSYEARTVNTSITEHELGSRSNWTYVRFSSILYSQWTMDAIDTGDERSGFSIWPSASQSISSWLSHKFTFSNSKYLHVQDEGGKGDWYRFFEDRTSSFFGDSQLLRQKTHIGDTINTVLLVGHERVLHNVAHALTTYIRMKGATDHRPVSDSRQSKEAANLGPIDPANGTAYVQEIYVRVRWPWLILLGTVLLSTAVFLALTMYQSSRYNVAAWKSEPLALMYHGIDPGKDQQPGLNRTKYKHSQRNNVGV